MVFRSNIARALILLYCASMVSASRWPYTVVPGRLNDILFSKKNSKSHGIVFARSAQTIKKERCTVLAHRLFDRDSVFKKPQKSTKVKVLLAQSDNHSATTWRLASSHGFVVNDVHKPQIKRFCADPISVFVKDGGFHLNGKSVTGAVCITPLCGYAEFNGTPYDGAFLIMPYKNNIVCINSVDVEDYIVAVLRTESWPGWPLEVNKAFAITSRSYVMNQVLEARKGKRPFDVKNTNTHQTYKGRHDSKMLKTAVEQTRGTVLGFLGKPILAMFDCCCGGIIPADIADFNFHKAPYLARVYPCEYCKKCFLYSWQLSYERKVFEQLLAQQSEKLFPLRGIRVTKRDKAGLVQEVRINGSNSAITLSGKKAYSLSTDIKSFCFTIYNKGGRVIFDGRGYGHHIGLCQWGAREMVREGHDYKSVLSFYYPGTRLMKFV